MLVFHSNSKTQASSIYIIHICKILVKNELYPFYVYVCSSTVFIVVLPPGSYMFQVNKGYQNDAIGVVLVSLLLTLNIFHTLF